MSNQPTTTFRVLASIMSIPKGTPIHCNTLCKWINAQPPYINQETIRSALRRLEKKSYVLKSSKNGYWIFNKKQTTNAISYIQKNNKTVSLDGVSRYPNINDITGLSGDWLDFAKVRFEANEPFKFRADTTLTKNIRSACDKERKGKNIDRSHKRSWHGKSFVLSITHKGFISIWAKEINFIQELNDFIGSCGISDEGSKRFFRFMFKSSPVTGTLEYPVIADKNIAKKLKTVVIETFEGDNKISTRFCSSHDSIEMEQKGNITGLQNFLGMITGIQHSTFNDALQVDKLTKIEEILKKSQTELSDSLNLISENMKINSDSMKINAEALKQITNSVKEKKVKTTPDKKTSPGVH